MEPEEGTSMQERIERARYTMPRSVTKEWDRRIRLHLAFFPPNSLKIFIMDDKIKIDPARF